MLKEFLAWWAARMLERVPERVRQFGAAADIALIIDIVTQGDPLTIALSRHQSGQDTALGRFTLDDHGQAALQAATQATRHRTIRLRLPPACLLERTLTLPLATERDVAGLLGYEIDRLTPFQPDEIFWRFTIDRRDRARGQMQLTLSLVPKAPWEPLLALLTAAGLSVSAIDLPQPGRPPRRISLDRDLSRRELWARRRRRGVAALYGVTGLAIVVLPFAIQAWALHTAEDQIAALQPTIRKAEALRRQIANGTTGIDAIATEQARIGDTLGVLAAVTDALPDDTYLTTLSLHDGHISLSGQSTAAARLIGALSDQHLFHNATFDAPITRSDQAKLDIFSIRAELAPAGPRP